MAQDTRERILAVAGELFTEHGYDGTSLREIADRLGFTKAALYYHFQSKEQIMEALLQPVQAMVGEFSARLEAAEDIEEWGEALIWVIDQMIGTDLVLFRLLQRNRNVIEQLGGWHEADSDHLQMHERLEASVRAKASSTHEQVRMFCALGAVTGFDDWAPNLMTDIPTLELAAELAGTVRDILGLPDLPMPPGILTPAPATAAAAAAGEG
jgi:AcrR family transcriptional regulator